MAAANPFIFDAKLVALHRARARLNEPDFLWREVADRMAERLLDFTRDFPLCLNLGAPLTSPKLKQITQHTLDESTPLPFPENHFDAVVALGGLHWINDLPGMLIQIQRALKPDGLFLGVLPGGDTLHELRQAVMEASLAEEGGLAPRVSPFLDLRDGGALLQRAGFALPVADAERITVEYANAFQLMHDLRAMGETNALIAQPKHFTRRATMMAIVETYQRLFANAEGRLPATFELVFLTGWKPASTQQQPAKRGSGKVSMSEALGMRD